MFKGKASWVILSGMLQAFQTRHIGARLGRFTTHFVCVVPARLLGPHRIEWLSPVTFMLAGRQSISHGWDSVRGPIVALAGEKEVTMVSMMEGRRAGIAIAGQCAG